LKEPPLGHIPRVEELLVVAFHGTGGHEAQLDRGSAEATDIAHLRQDVIEHGRLRASLFDGVPEAGGEQCMIQPGRVTDLQTLRATVGAAAVLCAPAGAQRRGVDAAGEYPPVGWDWF